MASQKSKFFSTKEKEIKLSFWIKKSPSSFHWVRNSKSSPGKGRDLRPLGLGMQVVTLACIQTSLLPRRRTRSLQIIPTRPLHSANETLDLRDLQHTPKRKPDLPWAKATIHDELTQRSYHKPKASTSFRPHFKFHSTSSPSQIPEEDNNCTRNRRVSRETRR